MRAFMFDAFVGSHGKPIIFAAHTDFLIAQVTGGIFGPGIAAQLKGAHPRVTGRKC